MQITAVFLLKVFVSFFDPIAMVGYIAAGALIRNYVHALCVGITWNACLLVFLAMPTAKAYGSLVPMFTIAVTFTSAIIATSIAFIIRRHFRRRAQDAKTTSPNA